MIETSNPEINVEELMERVRREAARVRQQSKGRVPTRAAAVPVALPPLPDLPAPPGLGSSGPVEIKKDRLETMLQQARATTEVSHSIPKFLRGFFRKQGGFNRALLDVVASLTKTNLQLNKRVQELQGAAQQHSDWFRILIEHRAADQAWMKAAAPIISNLAASQERLGLLAQHSDRFIELIAQAEQTGAHLRILEDRIANQQKTSDRTAEHLRDLQTQADTAGEHLRNLQRTVDQLPALLEQNERAGEHLRNLQVQVDRQSEYVRDLLKQDERQNEHLRNLQDHANRSGEHLRNLQDETDRAAEQAKDVRPLKVTSERLEAQIKHLASLHETLGRVEERQTSDAIYLKAQVSNHSILLQQLVRAAGKKNGAAAPAEAAPVALRKGDLDDFYVAFENRFRGTRAEIKERIRPYLPLVKKAKAGAAARPILDLGCGRGEWLELLEEAGLRATGVDLNAAMVEQCRERKLTAIQAEAIEHLRSLPANSHGGVSGFHIIEHLPFETLLELFMQTLRVLKPGGIAIFESPNCKNLFVGACYFNVDPTHRNPVFPETASFIMETHGFEGVQLEYLSPAERRLTAGDRDSELLNDFLFGPQDFAVIGRKPRPR